MLNYFRKVEQRKREAAKVGVLINESISNLSGGQHALQGPVFQKSLGLGNPKKHPIYSNLQNTYDFRKRMNRSIAIESLSKCNTLPNSRNSCTGRPIFKHNHFDVQSNHANTNNKKNQFEHDATSMECRQNLVETQNAPKMECFKKSTRERDASVKNKCKNNIKVPTNNTEYSHNVANNRSSGDEDGDERQSIVIFAPSPDLKIAEAEDGSSKEGSANNGSAKTGLNNIGSSKGGSLKGTAEAVSYKQGSGKEGSAKTDTTGDTTITTSDIYSVVEIPVRKQNCASTYLDTQFNYLKQGLSSIKNSFNIDLSFIRNTPCRPKNIIAFALGMCVAIAMILFLTSLTGGFYIIPSRKMHTTSQTASEASERSNEAHQWSYADPEREFEAPGRSKKDPERTSSGPEQIPITLCKPTQPRPIKTADHDERTYNEMPHHNEPPPPQRCAGCDYDLSIVDFLRGYRRGKKKKCYWSMIDPKNFYSMISYSVEATVRHVAGFLSNFFSYRTGE